MQAKGADVFAVLPSRFTKLELAVESLAKFSLSAPPQLEELGLRMRKLYAKTRDEGYKGLSRGAIRRLPYALWIEGERPLHEIEPGLVKAYWESHLPEAVSQPRAAKRWLSPLFYTYCHWFRRDQFEFQAFALNLREALHVAHGPFSDWMIELQSQHRWFSPDDVGAQLGRKLVSERGPLQETMAKMNLWSGFLDERIASEAFAGALRLPNDELSKDFAIQQVKSWSRSDAAGGRDKSVFRYPEHRILLADGLVRPWLQRPPPDTIRNGLLSFLMKHYGDPRQLNAVHRGHHWQGVSDPTINAVKRWLVGDTLRGFMRILQLTADDIWRYRERFWMAYYNLGVIDEAWVALGSQAALLAQREFGKSEWAQNGLLTLGAASDQSVLFIRIGHLVFMEWSHNGSLRACLQDDPQLPAMYQKEYSGGKLRLVRSMDFHNGMNQQPQLSHMNSEGGTWQRKARDFIAKHTGVRLNDQAILG